MLFLGSSFFSSTSFFFFNEVNLLINLTIKNIQNAIIKKLITLLINEPYLIWVPGITKLLKSILPIINPIVGVITSLTS